MIEVLLPRAEVFGQLVRLRANLRLGRLGPFGDRLRRGRRVERVARFGLMGDVDAGFRRASRGRRGCVLTIVGLGCGHRDAPCGGCLGCRRGKVIATGKVFPASYIGTRGGQLHIPRSYTAIAAKNGINGQDRITQWRFTDVVYARKVDALFPKNAKTRKEGRERMNQDRLSAFLLFFLSRFRTFALSRSLFAWLASNPSFGATAYFFPIAACRIAAVLSRMIRGSTGRPSIKALRTSLPEMNSGFSSG